MILSSVQTKLESTQKEGEGRRKPVNAFRTEKRTRAEKGKEQQQGQPTRALPHGGGTRRQDKRRRRERDGVRSTQTPIQWCFAPLVIREAPESLVATDGGVRGRSRWLQPALTAKGPAGCMCSRCAGCMLEPRLAGRHPPRCSSAQRPGRRVWRSRGSGRIGPRGIEAAPGAGPC